MAILAGRYELERRLGGGGMAEVFLARLVGKDGFSRKVAIKRVLAHLATEESFAKMFVAEAQMCAKLQHPNIVSVLDFDRDEDGRPFLVIELVDGPSLAELADGGALPVGAALYLASELLRGVAYAHDLPGGEGGVRGIVHRDISPHNVLLSWEGAVKVSDFGIAKARAASGVTASELLKGKPAYMSPEQANGEALDGRSDLFSVGIMMWELLVGRALFSGHTTQETLARVLFAPIPTPRSIRPELPEDVDAIVLKLLARERADRFADANDVIAALLACKDYPRDGREKLVALLADRFMEDAPQRSRALADVPTVRTPLEAAPTLPSPRDAKTRKQPMYLALGALAVAGGAVAITLIATRSSNTPATKVAMVEDAPVAIDAMLHARLVADAPESEPHADGGMDGVQPKRVMDASVAMIPSDAMRSAPRSDGGLGKHPREAELQAERARILAASKGPASIPFSPPDETSVDATQYFERARAEVRRIFGRDGVVTALSYGNLGPDGRVDGTRMGVGINIVFEMRPPSEDGFHCVNVFSYYRPEAGGRFRFSLLKSEEYCKSLRRDSSMPRCTAQELHARAVALGLPSQERMYARLAAGQWHLREADSPNEKDVKFEGTAANDCH
jgi:serine/threonine protein kinase